MPKILKRSTFLLTFTILLGIVIFWGCPAEQGQKQDGGVPEKRGQKQDGDVVEGQREFQGEKIAQRGLDEPLGADETRAGKIQKETELLKGLQAINRLGDWKIYNSKVAFVIHGVMPSRSWGGRGGHLIDASVVNEKGQAVEDLLDEVTPMFMYAGFRMIKATKIEVVEAGGRGKKAVIRAYVTDVGIPILDQAIHSQKIGVAMTIDYILKPNVNYLEIVTHVGDGRIQTLSIGDGLMFGCYTKLFTPLKGWKTGKLNGQKFAWLAAVGERTTYLLSSEKPDKKFSVLLQKDSIIPVKGEELEDSVEKGTYRRYLFVTKGSLESALEAYRALHKIQYALPVKAVVKGLSDPMEARVSILDATGKALTQARPDEKGNVEFKLKEWREDYTFLAVAPGHAPVKAKILSKAKSSPQSLIFQKGAKLILKISEKTFKGEMKGFVPVRLDISGPESSIVDYVYPEQAVLLRPGKYKIVASRGFEYEYVKKEIELKAGEIKNLSIVMEQAVDSSGYVGGDMHLHASPSIDSDLPLRKRVAALVAEGLRFAASSDHDTSYDYGPLVKEMGLTHWIRTVAGEEVSPIKYHFNAYPVIREPTAPLYFAIPWVVYNDGEYERSLLAPEIWKLMRKQYKAKIVQINHPRSSQGFFDVIHYDPKVGLAGLDKGVFDTNWDCLEVYNSASGRNVFMTKTLWDWFSLLNQGILKTAVGNSDSHTVSARPGMPRNLIASSHRDGEKIDVEEILTNLKKGHVQLCAGPFLKVRANGTYRPGDTVKGPKIKLDITVQAPSWISVAYVKIYANEKLLKKLDVPASQKHERFHQSLTFEPKKDTWYVVIAGDDKGDMAPVYRGKYPISMTNPIYLDIDGKGFKAPGLHP